MVTQAKRVYLCIFYIVFAHHNNLEFKRSLTHWYVTQAYKFEGLGYRETRLAY